MTDLKAAVVIDLKGDLPAQSKRFQNNLEAMSTGGSRKLAIMGRNVITLSNQIDRLGNRAMLGAGGLGIVFKRSFVDTAAEFERFSIQLEQLEGSAEAGKKAMAWVSDFAVRTPLELNEVTEAYAKLRTFGMDPMDGTLQALVDQNSKMAGSSAELQGIILAVGQAWTKQKLQAEEANQLIERKVPVWDLLSKATGKTSTQLIKMAEGGKLGRKEIKLLLAEIAKNAAGSSEKFAQTWEGKISNLNDLWTRWKLQVMDAGTFDFLKGEIDGLLGDMNRLQQNGQLSESAKTVSQELVSGLKSAKEMAGGLWVVMKQVGAAAKFVADQVGGFENLAKGLAYLYVGNKALQAGAGAAKVGGGIAQAASVLLGGKGKAGKIADAISAANATPVRVVNWPGGFGGVGGSDLLGLPGKKGAPKAAAKNALRVLKSGAARAGALGVAAAPWLAAGAAGGAIGYGIGKYAVNPLLEKGLNWASPGMYDKFGDSVGRAVAKSLAFLGNEEAKQALKIELELSGDSAPRVKVKNKDKNLDFTQTGAVMGTR